MGCLLSLILKLKELKGTLKLSYLRVPGDETATLAPGSPREDPEEEPPELKAFPTQRRG